MSGDFHKQPSEQCRGKGGDNFEVIHAGQGFRLRTSVIRNVVSIF
jgi:hypothetical protein